MKKRVAKGKPGAKVSTQAQEKTAAQKYEEQAEKARAGSLDEEASKRLQAALARFGIRLGTNPETNYKDLRDAWTEALTEAWEKITGKSARWESKQEAFKELCKLIRSGKLVSFLEVDPDARAAPQEEVTKRATRAKTVQPQTQEDTTMATKNVKAKTKAKAPAKKEVRTRATSESVVTLSKMATEKDALPPQAVAILETLQKGGKKMTREKLIAALKGKVKSSQPLDRIFSFYRAKLVDGGFIKIA